MVVVAAGEAVVGLDIDDGTQLWSYAAKPNMTFEDCSPTTVDGVVYVAEWGVDTTLYAINVLTGERLWEASAGTNYGANTPTVYGDYVLMTTYDGTVRFFDRQSGAIDEDLRLEFADVRLRAGHL